MTKSTAPETVMVDGEEMETVKVEYKGITYTLRELSVNEGDEIDDAADGQKPQVAQRLTMRMALQKAIVDPPTTIDQVSKWGGKKYVVLSRAFNKLNTVPDGNPTPEAGSAGPTSPAGGEPSPAT